MTRRLLLALALAGAAVAGVVVANAHSPHAPRISGRIVQASFHSDALRGTDHFAVYLPPGYAHSGERYPVVYFLHGLPQTPTAYRAVIASVAHAVDRSGYQAIVVAPQGARAGESDPEWLDRGPGHNWETATAVELVRTVDSRYRTIASRRGRLLIGISAGGYGATLIADHNPGTYSVIESWSGYFHATNPAGTAPLDLGSEEANDWADFHKQIPQLRQQFGRWFTRTWFGFYVGTNDPHFVAENRRLYAELRAARVPHVLFRIYQGGHNWGLWQSHAVDWMRAGLARAARAH